MAKRTVLFIITLALLAGPCFTSLSLAAEWKLTKVARLLGFRAPESVAVDPESGVAYVSNINPATGPDGEPRYWEDDGKGFISRIEYMKDDGNRGVVEGKWIIDTPQARLYGPKGLCLVGDKLYVNDNSHFLIYDVSKPKAAPTVVEIPDAQNLNDVASDGSMVYVTDTARGKIYEVKDGKYVKTLNGPEAINGITISDGKQYAVSWGLHDLYHMPEVKPYGLADHFKTLDSIEVLEDESLLVTDFQGNKICVVSPDGKTVTTLAETETPADLGFDRVNNLVFVPSVEGDFVEIYQLSKE